MIFFDAITEWTVDFTRRDIGRSLQTLGRSAITFLNDIVLHNYAHASDLSCRNRALSSGTKNKLESSLPRQF